MPPQNLRTNADVGFRVLSSYISQTTCAASIAPSVSIEQISFKIIPRADLSDLTVVNEILSEIASGIITSG
jgi:hypothetical protein